MDVFEDRGEAGRHLAQALGAVPELSGKGRRVVVLAIPRGGVPVGVEVARTLGAKVAIAVIRKLRAPGNLELGYGAVGPDGFVEVDQGLVARLGLTQEQIDAEVVDRHAAVGRRLALYRQVADAVELSGATVVVVDDGIATGSTARWAIDYARRAGALAVVLAVPVAPRAVVEELGAAVDQIVVLSQPAEFLAVSQAYRDFAQLDDADVLEELGGMTTS